VSEPEEVLIEAAHAATVRSAALWRRVRPAAAGPPGLAEIQRRLAIFLEAICPGAPPIAVADPPAVPTWLGRLARRVPAHVTERHALASTDGARIRLPRHLDPDLEGGLHAYRLLALGQAVRARRGSPAVLAADTPRLVADLFAIAEAAAVERDLARLAPGLLPALEALRRRALAARPPLGILSPAERAVERLVAALLAAPVGDPPCALPRTATPAESLAWAQAFADTLPAPAPGYRGLAPVALWGRLEPLPPPVRATSAEGGAPDIGPVPAGRTRTLVRRPRVREAAPDEDDPGQGIWMAPTSDRQESVEDPLGLTRPIDRDGDTDPGGLADSLAELPEARLVRTPGTPREVLVGEDPPAVERGHVPGRGNGAPGIAYPEWDWRVGAYLPGRAIVHLVTPAEGPAGWADQVLRRHAPLVHLTRRRFERLRPRRVRLLRQVDGPEIDLEACVEAFADARTGHTASDRLYAAEPPLRRSLALLVLIDASASTDAWVDGNRRIVDVEKEAMLVLCAGLDALGDRYAILPFSGEGPGRVQVPTLKAFAARNDETVRRRIAGIEPERYTRLGAAIRHATGVLGEEGVAHRMLLVLSDGKPNDVDHYEGRYGVEDARQAVLEARAEGVHPFCLTVDRQAAADLPRIFGPSGFTLLRQVPALPTALLDAVRRLVR
jgi:nitric oxide reductase NorD protein